MKAFQPVRPLVVPVTPFEGESLIGLVARATSANVLGATRHILDEVGLPLLKPGLAGQEFGGVADRLAAKIGSATKQVCARLHPYAVQLPSFSGSSKSNWSRTVTWGAGALERHLVHIETRRIAPTSLVSSPHHRAGWMCNLLPYCTESLEPLVNRCDTCGTLLGWRFARGIGVCEHCRGTVAASRKEPLAAEFAESYRRFARLVSIVPAERELELAALAPDLSALAPAILVRLVQGLGRVFEPARTVKGTARMIADGDLTIAPAVARGMEVASDWPVRLRAEMAARLEVSPDQRSQLIARIRGLAGIGRQACPEIGALLRTAVPEAFERMHRAMSLGGPAVLATELCDDAGISLSEVRRLEQAGLLDGDEVIAGTRIYRQYQAYQTRPIVDAWRGSTRASMLVPPLGAPAYAVEQLACLGEVEREASPAVLALDDRLRITAASIDAFTADLGAACRRDDAPDGLVSLNSLARRCGGRMKSWGNALARLRRGDVPHWRKAGVAADTIHAHHLLLRPKDAAGLFDEPFDQADFQDFPFGRHFSKKDAEDVLKITSAQMPRLVAGGVVTFERSGHAHGTPRGPVLALAARMVATSEMAFYLNQNFSFTYKLMERYPQVRSHCLGWWRRDVVEHWDELVAFVASRRDHVDSGRVLSAPLTEGHAELASHRLKLPLACIA